MNPSSSQSSGVNASRVILPAGDWPTVLDFLLARFPAIAESEWRSRLERGLVTGDDGMPLDAHSRYVAGACIHYFRELEAETPIPGEAEILFQDEHLLAADKPHFLPVMPAGRFLKQTLLLRLQRQTGLQDLAPLHRIDRGTAGVVLFSTDARSRGRYQALFAQREVGKVYEALAPRIDGVEFPLVRRSHLVAGEPFFRMREASGSPNSETQVEVAEARGAQCLYLLRPVTGKKHQLRVHLAALGAPIVNDPFYPELQADAPDDFSQPLKLLARSIAFADPLDGRARRFDSRRSL